jgi:ABC-type nitrate/sulfonate/bicarbonate transport system permease component
VVPSLVAIGRALFAVVANPEFYHHLGVTLLEVASALAIGGALGLRGRFCVGRRRFLAQAFEHYVLLSRADAEDHLLSDHDHVVRGWAPASKVAMGNAVLLLPDRSQRRASGMRQIDPVLIRVGQSFQSEPLADRDQDSIFRPCVRRSLNGVRLGLGVAIIGTLLAETKAVERRGRPPNHAGLTRCSTCPACTPC